MCVCVCGMNPSFAVMCVQEWVKSMAWNVQVNGYLVCRIEESFSFFSLSFYLSVAGRNKIEPIPIAIPNSQLIKKRMENIKSCVKNKKGSNNFSVIILFFFSFMAATDKVPLENTKVMKFGLTFNCTWVAARW